VLLDVVTEIRLRCLGAGDQHLGDAIERIADLAKELMLGADAAAVLLGFVSMRLDLGGLRLVGVELYDLSGVVVEPDHGVLHRHWNSFK
jgi:hypothetical protein